MEDKEKRYRLELIGITYQQVESNVFALILQQEGTNRRIPIFIGYSEAQAIECKLQDVETPRPLTHDTMLNTLSAFGISLLEVEIRQLPNGVFAANLILSDGMTTRSVDSRSSDAVALAVRVGAPIYTTESVLKKAGFDSDSSVSGTSGAIVSRTAPKPRQKSEENIDDIRKESTEHLQQRMQHYVEAENYEMAGIIKAELDRRKNSSESREE